MKEEAILPALDIDFLNPNQHFKFKSKRVKGITVSRFWRWAFSDLISNITRGILAEFIVGIAINSPDLQYPRAPWDPYDLELRDGTRIEVKSASYLQSWEQKNFSKIQFDVRSHIVLGQKQKQKKRQSDVYVFCLLKCKDKAKINPLNLDQWEFYIIRTSTLNHSLGKYASKISLDRVKRLGILADFKGIKKAIKQTLHK